MTKPRRLDDRNVETRKARLAPRRILASLALAATVAAIAFVLDSLRQSVAQLGAAAANVTLQAIEVAPAPSIEPRLPAPLDTPEPNQLTSAAEIAVEPGLGEPAESLPPFRSGPPSADEFAQLVEAGVLRDVETDPEAAADLRGVLEAAALESVP
jgi:hypothetical protein